MTTAVDEWMARGDDETVLWDGRPRTTSAIPGVVGSLFVAAIALFFVVSDGQPALLLLVVVGLLSAVWTYLRVVYTRFAVTDRALYRKTGILSRTVQRVAFRRVQNSTFRQGITGSLFGYGTIHVEAAGGGAIRFNDVVSPQAVRELVERGRDVDEVPGSLQQWEAVLSEVRALRRALDSTTRST